MHTKDKLAAELRIAGLAGMADKAADGYYHDFLSPLDAPCLQLAADLAGVGTPTAMALRARAINGEFDASKEEGDHWAGSKEGRETFDNLATGMNRAERRKQRHASARQQYEAQRAGGRLGDAPVEQAYHEQLVGLMQAVDEVFNGDAKGPDKKVGVVMLVFPYGDIEGRCNFVSNGANRQDIVVLMKEMIARFEGQPDLKGNA